MRFPWTTCAALVIATGAAVAPATAVPDEPAPDAADVAGRLSDHPETAHRVAELTRRAIAQIGRRDWRAAEQTLGDALALAPGDPANLYNLACTQSRLGKPDAALTTLAHAASAGFGDFDLIGRDPDLAAVRALPQYGAFAGRAEEFQRAAADRTLASLRQRFGYEYRYGIDSDHKLVYATNLDEPTLAELKESIEAQARGQARDLFANKPRAYVTVVVPSAADYHKVMRLRNVGGAYFPATRTLVAQKVADVMRHEFTHALHAADLAPLGQTHAPWVVEGLGVLYESAEIIVAGGSDVMVPTPDNARLPGAQVAARRHGLIPLGTLLAMSEGEFVKRPNLTYTEAGALMLYLRELGTLRAFYDEYKKSYDADATGRAALEHVTGTDLDAFESDWVKWLLARPPAPFFGGPALFLGARVAPGPDGMTVISVAPYGPAADAGIEPRDVIVAVNGKKVSDYASLRPALGTYTAGKIVTIRVRHGGSESDVPVKLQSLTSSPRILTPR